MTPPFLDRLKIPAIAAPMTGVSSLTLVAAACRAGVAGSFPVHNARSSSELDEWMSQLNHLPAYPSVAPWIPNLIVHHSNRRLDDQVDAVVRHRPKAVITSVGDPSEVVDDLHKLGTAVWADVATLRHAERSVAAGVDGLVLLTAGAGGKTGWANPFAFVRSVRQWYHGTIILAGGVCDGFALSAARALGCDLAYIGTPLIATEESQAPDVHKRLIHDSTMDDVVLSSRIDGLPASLLSGSPGLGDNEPTEPSAFTHGDRLGRAARMGLYSAGHGVSLAGQGLKIADVVERFTREFVDATSGSDIHYGDRLWGS